MLRAVLSVVVLSLVVPAAAHADPRSDRQALLVKIADATDRAERDQVAVVQAEDRQNVVDQKLAGALDRVRARALSAYMYGFSRTADSLDAPNVYLERVFREERKAITDLRSAKATAAKTQADAGAARDASRAAEHDLESLRAQLDAAVAKQEADEAAVAARKAAMEAAAQERLRLQSAGDAAIVRYRDATTRQQAAMAKWPFGPVSGVPAGLKPDGAPLAGLASWYGSDFDGRPTASGAIYDQEGWTVANKELPLGTFVVITANGRSVLLLVNDRGPYIEGRVFDLSHAAAHYLGTDGAGVAMVQAQVVVPA